MQNAIWKWWCFWKKVTVLQWSYMLFTDEFSKHSSHSIPLILVCSKSFFQVHWYNNWKQRSWSYMVWFEMEMLGGTFPSPDLYIRWMPILVSIVHAFLRTWLQEGSMSVSSSPWLTSFLAWPLLRTWFQVEQFYVYYYSPFQIISHFSSVLSQISPSLTNFFVEKYTNKRQISFVKCQGRSCPRMPDPDYGVRSRDPW